MAEVLAVVGLAYPIAKDLFKLANKLRTLYKQIRNAKNDLPSVIKRTRSLARTYDFFRDTMKVARKIQELAPMFKRHRQLMGSIEEESIRTIGRLKHITDKFRSLIDSEPISTVERWIAQFEWSRVSKKTVPSLFQDMKVLERSMRTIGTLVHIQLLSKTRQRDGSAVVVAQFESFTKMLGIEFDKLRQAQRVQKKLMMQQQISPSQHHEATEFAQKIMQILEKEIPRLKNHQPAESQSMTDSRSPPTSPISNEPSPITTPSPSAPSRSGSQTSVSKLQQDEDVSSPGRQIPRKRRTQSAPSVSTTDLRTSQAHTNVTENPTTMIVKALSQKCLLIKMQVKIKEAHICRCHLLDHQNWFLARSLDDPLLIVLMGPAIHLTSNVQCIVVALIQLEDGGTTAKYLNMGMEVR
ncbi:hypothetical protein CNMCM5793_006579 [Aspergillus hiratsukae]|uniref:Fungal N-terminal domain-containing protein n=1 Tax=Aspergillus hiratsukae TaxID=1194566 RepID=A0A8H6V2J4_9EURO|nr:hypothetical protein CNMCM5793_006579 [Aspergillus hiratsukae]KAF7172994.1 hypothetical protein CNMCM6106_007156 [Aspergillus hiratsukae]